MAKENFIIFSSAIVDKNKFDQSGGFPEHFLNSTDYWLFMHMARAYNCGVIQEVCCKYRIHSENMSATQQVISAQEAIDVLMNLLPDERVLVGLREQYVSLAVMYIKEIEIFKAVVVMVKHRCFIKVLKRIIVKLKKC